MDLDDLKQTWQEQDSALDANLRLRTFARHAGNVRQTDTAGRRLVRGLWIEVILSFVATLLFGSFLADHILEPRFLVPAAMLQLAAVLSIATGVRQLVAAKMRDDSEPVVAVQKRLESLRVERLRATKWTFLVAPLLWTPLLIVGLKGLWGLDAWAAFPPAYLPASLLFGLAMIPLGLWLARRFADRLACSPLLQRLARDLAGRNLNAALASLASLAEFEREEAVGSN